MGMLRRWLVALGAMACTALLAVGCGSSGHKASRAQLEGALLRLNIPPVTVTCVADRLTSRLSASELNAIIDQATLGSAQVSEQSRQELIDAIRPCAPASTTTTVAIPAPSTSAP